MTIFIDDLHNSLNIPFPADKNNKMINLRKWEAISQQSSIVTADIKATVG